MKILPTPEFGPLPGWIQGVVEQVPAPKEGGVKLGAILPPGYSYAKIFHPILIDPRIKNDHLTWDDLSDRYQARLPSEAKDSSALSDLFKGAKLVQGSPDHPFEGVRIRWKELCEKLNLQYHPELNDNTFTRNFAEGSWPRYLVGPAEGTLDIECLRELLELLRPCSSDEPCELFYSPFAMRNMTPLLMECPLEEILETVDGVGVNGTPTYWWPFSKTWCVCSDPDLTCSFVAGSRDLIDRLVRHPGIESMPVKLTDRVDRNADHLNP